MEDKHHNQGVCKDAINIGISNMNALPKQPIILVVDDEPHLRNSLSAILSLHGYTTSTADGGKSAMEALANKHFDLVLLDLCMPDVDGHQVMD
ncbi:MAG: response regulator, partial [Sulfurimicrobium sp.]|nr:response regulator [Sulfurimicrobium sp.]